MFSFLDVWRSEVQRQEHRKHRNPTENTEMQIKSLSSFSVSSVYFLRFLCSAFVFLTFPTTQAKTKFEGIGRPATPAEVKAWDIDVRPDFKGLPPGKGSVVQGEKIWEAQCAGCHGSFGESNEVFTPIAGNTTAKDIETGKVAALTLGANTPQRTTLMKLPSLSTLWDYVNRAMPWTAPKSLSADEVYAVTAYMLSLGNIVSADFTLSDQNIREVQKRLPNRNGTTTAHAMWTSPELGGTRRPDVQGSHCMKDCKQEPSVSSLLPAHARDAHGNLAEQSRGLGGSRGADTTKPTASLSSIPARPVAPIAMQNIKPNQSVAVKEYAQSATNSGVTGSVFKSSEVMPTLQKYACAACHGIDTKLVGPSFKDIATKQGKRADAQSYLAGKIKSGSQGVYGQIPMPAQSISEAEAARVAQWLVQGAQK
jgi:S-disulfanyl-L-cysteine oxidoreductase SoxD